jgi:hypothetical protein
MNGRKRARYFNMKDEEGWKNRRDGKVMGGGKEVKT